MGLRISFRMRVETLLEIQLSVLFNSTQSGGFYYLTTAQLGYHCYEFINIEDGNVKTVNSLKCMKLLRNC